MIAHGVHPVGEKFGFFSGGGPSELVLIGFRCREFEIRAERAKRRLAIRLLHLRATAAPGVRVGGDGRAEHSDFAAAVTILAAKNLPFRHDHTTPQTRNWMRCGTRWFSTRLWIIEFNCLPEITNAWQYTITTRPSRKQARIKASLQANSFVCSRKRAESVAISPSCLRFRTTGW